jgi:hypothetical protein
MNAEIKQKALDSPTFTNKDIIHIFSFWLLT